MAVQVGVTGTTVGSVQVSGSRTQVRQIIVGTPVKSVSSGAFVVQNIGGFNVTNAVEGAVLVYDAASGDFVAKKQLTDTDVDGGQY